MAGIQVDSVNHMEGNKLYLCKTGFTNAYALLSRFLRYTIAFSFSKVLL